MSLVSDIINQAFVNLRVIPTGGGVGTDMQTGAFARLNQLLGSLSTEGAIVFNQVMQTFTLTVSVDNYTLGNGGTFATTGSLRAQKVTAWKARNGDMVKGGPVLSMAEFAMAADAKQLQLAELYKQAALEGVITTVPATITAPIPSLVGVDTAYPLINVRIFPPPPASSPGSIELAYWTPIASFATVGDTVSLPPGFEEMLHLNLAVQLYPEYRDIAGPIDPMLEQNAAQSKVVIIQQNTIMSQQQAPAPAREAA